MRSGTRHVEILEMLQHLAGAWRSCAQAVRARHGIRASSSAAIRLRPYQEECVRQCLGALRRGETRIGVSSPTGSGKTTIFTELLRRIQPKSDSRGRVLILVNAVTLAIQASNMVRRMLPGLSVEIEQGSRYVASGKADVTVATVQSLMSQSRIDKYDPSEFKCVIVSPY